MTPSTIPVHSAPHEAVPGDGTRAGRRAVRHRLTADPAADIEANVTLRVAYR